MVLCYARLQAACSPSRVCQAGCSRCLQAEELTLAVNEGRREDALKKASEVTPSPTEGAADSAKVSR